MAKEISVALFEKNAKEFNKKNLRRSFSSFYTRYSEYIPLPPLSARNKVVLEATLDKGNVEDFQQFLKDRGFSVLGDTNYYHLDNVVEDYKKNADMFTNQKDAVEAIEKDLVTMHANTKPYKEIENEDTVFYFLPYNDQVSNIFEFIGKYKEEFLKYAVDNDITLMFKISGFTNQIDGFFGFNFFDADVKDQDVVVDYASRINVRVDFSKRSSVFAAAILLNAVGDDEDEVNAMNVHILAENLKYEQE